MAGQGASAAKRIKDRIRAAQTRLSPFQAEAIAASNGVVTIREAGVDEEPQLQAVPALRGSAIEPGDTTLMLPIGDGDSWVALGAIDDGSEPVPIGRTYHKPDSASSATDPSTTSDTIWRTVRAVSWGDLPDGTYDIVVEWSAQFSDSVSAQLNYRANIGPLTGTSFTLSVGTARERISFTQEASAVVVAGGLTVTIQYKRNTGATAGTATARNPSAMLHATRVG